MGAEDDGFLVELAGMACQVVGAEDEGHGGEGTLGGEKVFDEDFDRDGCGGRDILAMLLKLVVWAGGVQRGAMSRVCR